MEAMVGEPRLGAAGAATAAHARARLAQRHGLIVLLVVVVAAGLAIRIRCADGPLWQDEIWSIENLAPLTHFWQVFWGISHDNNHFLNSLWLYFAVPFTANETILRAPSILMGAATIAMMARLGLRHSPAAAAAAAAMTALSYFFVNYSVEARGYAGGALALAVGFDALERSLALPESPARFVLAAAMGIGLFWHLAIVPAIGLYALIAVIEERRRIGRWEPALAAAIRLFAPTGVAAAPALACVVAGVMVTGHLTIGGLRGFEAGLTLKAIGEMARDAIGLPVDAPAWAIVAAGAGGVLAALWLRLVLDSRRSAYTIILIVLPAAVFLVRPPNAHIARYYLVCALFLILLLAEAFGSLWRAGALPRVVALAALAAILIGDMQLVMRFEASKREAWPQALAAIEDSGQLRLASNFDDRVGKFVDYFNRGHPPLELVARADWCAKRPSWLIAETAGLNELPPSLDLAAPGCRVQFTLQRRYESWGLSQVGRALYRAP